MGNRDIYQEVTDNVLAALERGTVPWRQPWRAGGAQRNLQSKRPYRSTNALLTELVAMERGYESPYWTTYRAAKQSGGMVRKGEKGTLVTFWKFLRVKPKDPTEATNADGTKSIPFLRGYHVFNVAECDGLEIPGAPSVDDEPIETLTHCEEVIAAMPEAPAIFHGGDRAFYVPAADKVQLPNLERFTDSAAYYATAFHELADSTGHADRLGRPGIMERHRFGDDDYSREELVAEMSAAFVARAVGIGTDTLERSAAYLDSWITTLKEDKRAVVTAAGAAQKAADWILNERSEETAA